MSGGVVLTFDPALESAVRELQRLAAETCGGPLIGQELMPHITLLIADGLDQNAWEAGLGRLAAAQPPFALSFGAAASFFGAAGVVYLAPGVSLALATLQSQALDLARRLGATPQEYMHAGAWTPHCTLGLGIADQLIGPTIAAVRARCAGLAGHAVALVPFRLDGERALTGPALPLAGG